MTARCFILLCIALTVGTKTVPIHRDTVQSNDVNPVPVLIKVPAPDTKITPIQPLDTHHRLLKELFKTARKVQTGTILKPELAGNSLVLDLNNQTLPDLLLDIKPALNLKGNINGKCS